MAEETFSFGALGKLDDGYTARLLDKLLREAVASCYDRPGDERARTLTLKLHVTPQSQGATCVGVNLEAEVGPLARPTERTGLIGMRVGERNTLRFNPMSPDNPDQLTLDEMGSDAKR